MPSTSSVKFDISDCMLREQSEEHLGWSTGNGVYLVLRVPKSRTNCSFDLQDLVAAKSFFSQQSASNGGVLLEMEKVKVASHTALRGLFKYRSPIPQSLGMMYVNILWMSFGDWSAQLNVESLENGETGVREATVFMIEGESRDIPKPSEPMLVANVEEMFTHMRAQPLRTLPSDSRNYDQSFPDHPLSKVRHRMEQVIATVSISAEAIAPVPQKITKWWKFW
jgi:hypothetical protein